MLKGINVIYKITSKLLNATKLSNLLKTASGHLHTRSVIDSMKMLTGMVNGYLSLPSSSHCQGPLKYLIKKHPKFLLIVVQS